MQSYICFKIKLKYEGKTGEDLAKNDLLYNIVFISFTQQYKTIFFHYMIDYIN